MKHILFSIVVVSCVSLSAMASKAGDTSSIVTFAIIGDYGSGDTNELHVANMVDGWNPEFIITVGDNSYDDDSGDNLDINVGRYYGKYIYNPKNPKVHSDPKGKASLQKKNLFFPCMGNHDAKNEASFTNYLAYFDVPKNYTFSWGPCSFYFFYSGPHGHASGNGEFDAETKAYINSSLSSKTAGDSFKLVFFHHPPHSSNMMGNPKINAAFDFDTMNVDAVICGHEHQYERISHARPGVTPIYVVNGSGGAELTPDSQISRRALGPDLVSSFLDNHHFGAVKATLITTSMNKVLHFEYYTVDGQGSHLVDQYFLEK
ncbi:MAG: phoA [Bacteroidetes bacterium]|nr:phoA [Bacteroidota bacterium]